MDAEPSPSASIPAGIDPALLARQDLAWEVYRLAALRQQSRPSQENLAACARTHAAFERLFCGPTDPEAAPLFARVHGRRARNAGAAP